MKSESVDFLILVLEISPKYLPRRKVLMLAQRRGLRHVYGRTAFGDAYRTDAESVSRRFIKYKIYVIRSRTRTICKRA